MRTAHEIVAEISREISATAGETIDGLQARADEFRREAMAQPAGTIAREIAATVAMRLDAVRTALTMSWFAL